MGYTHYWYRPEVLPADEWKAFHADVCKVIAHTDVSICGPFGDGKPKLTKKTVSLNGNESRREGYETFRITQKFDNSYRSYDDNKFLFDCCKTAQMPYDTVVTAILILLAYHFPEGCKVSSDGDVKDWQEGLRLAEDATGRSLMIPIRDER